MIMGYPSVHVTNSTGFSVSVDIDMIACSDASDSNLANGGTFVAPGKRGACLLKRVGAAWITGQPSHGIIQPYESSGTSYSKFTIAKASSPRYSYAVTRVVTCSIEPPLSGWESSFKQYNLGEVSSEINDDTAYSRIGDTQLNLIHHNWPTDFPDYDSEKTRNGVFLDWVDNIPTSPPPLCVKRLIDECLRDWGLPSSQEAVHEISVSIMKNVAEKGFVPFHTGTTLVENDRSLYWGLSAIVQCVDEKTETRGVIYGFACQAAEKALT